MRDAADTGQAARTAQQVKPAPAALTRRWERASERVVSMGQRLGRNYEPEWAWLQVWRDQVAGEGLDLPAPWVFADQQNNLVLEWQAESRLLTVRLVGGGRSGFEYAKSVDDDETEDEEGSAAIAEVQRLLLWVLGG